MKNSGNIRKIDELGRIVIPRDIRKKLHILTNDSLDIYIEDNSIRIDKYSPFTSIINELNELLDLAERITGNYYLITDKERIITSSHEEFLGERISKCIYEYIDNSKPINSLSICNKYLSKDEFNILALNIDSLNQGVIIEVLNNKANTQDVLRILKGIIEKRLNNY